MRILGLLPALLLLAGCAASPEVVATESTSSAEAVEATAEATPEQAIDETDAVAEESPSAEPAAPQDRETAESDPSPSVTPTPRTTATPKATSTSRPTPTQEPSPSPEPTVTAGPVFVSRAEVAKNNTRASCWAIIDGSVYNLTRWINQHPGGTSAIVGLCGSDATNAFDRQHGGQSGPSSVLDDYFIALLED